MLAPLLAVVAFALTGCGSDTPLRPEARGLDAAIDGARVRLTWARPPLAARVRLLRRLDTPPQGAGDPLATVLFEGRDLAFDDRLGALLPATATSPRTYHYALYACRTGGECFEEASRAAVAPTLLQCLRAGGYAIWWRHASATVCSDRLDLGTAATTTAPDWWKSCDAACPPEGSATARQLSDAGVAEAIAIGQSFDQLGIPVGRVISSEYCRCVRTAELNDFGPPIEQDPGVTYFVYDEANRCASSMARIAELPPAGANTAIIGQAGFPGSCPTLGALAWGEAAIYKPAGDGTATLIARLRWDEWPGLASFPVAASGGL